MTIPIERTNAINYTRQFLLELRDPKATPRVPREIRERAHRLLRHYPSDLEIQLAVEGKEVFGKKELEPFEGLAITNSILRSTTEPDKSVIVYVEPIRGFENEIAWQGYFTTYKVNEKYTSKDFKVNVSEGHTEIDRPRLKKEILAYYQKEFPGKEIIFKET